MRKIKFIGGTQKFLTTMVLCVCAAVTFGQDAAKQDSLSVSQASVYQLLKPSCMPCHSNEGRDKPRNAVNFSVWKQYTQTERLMLASSIQKEVQKGSMPPRGFVNSHPGTSLDSLQIKKIVIWCDSIKSIR
jgi:cytochrome c